MRYSTYCEDGYINIVPALKVALIISLLSKGQPLREACRCVNMSITAYERHKKDSVEKIQKIREDKEISQMIDSLSSRIINKEKIDPMLFCLVCSKSRRLFNLPVCF
ncbi:hypothetical protein SULI_10630 [Saccharolobus solfataricus]|uniref:Uncharacterized protein n=3 Tax=Saccharolobus solfataricus TaxID=2287 RepID=Q97Z37_SACS2|nr:Hypothetical protein SSO1102 [Saccharolobus solfataricus P2]AKA74303.1 hypothetical protein SULB_2108 [Saccharolobus solfataricus]AKA76999.1 hypothetical protein SULC_2106 [Saccharolobus solfataricus]AKA79691.1 hypothetical protein SULA_2107 [Saccharolobus solfataricus]AZF68786.1 hypothetical protein SULG_10630 [Saccharolobus solfataricus]